MAYTIDVTKVGVDKVMDKMYNITLNLSCLDGAEEVIDQNFTEDHRIGKSVSYTIAKFLVAMQGAIDDYKAEQNIFDSAALDNAILSLESDLEG